MPGQMTLTRQQQIVPYQANSLVASPQLGLSYQYRFLSLTLKGAISGGANFATTNILPGDEWACLKKIEIKINGGDVIQSFTGEQLANIQPYLFDRPRLLSPLLGGTQSSFASTIVMPFWDEKGRVPFDTMLDSSRLTDLRLEATWGDVTSITNQSVSAFATNPSLTITSRECFGLKGKKTGTVPKFSLSRRYQKFNPSSIPVQNDYPFYLDVGNIYKGIWINTKDSSGNDLSACIDRLRIVSGTHVFIDTDYKTLRDTWALRNRSAFQLDNTKTGTSYDAMTLPLGLSSNTKWDAWTYVDFRDDGFNTEAIDTYTLSELKLLLNTNQTINTLMVMPDLVVPLRKKSA